WNEKTLTKEFPEDEKDKDPHLTNCTPKQKEELERLLEDNSHMFAEDMTELGETTVYEHRIPTGDEFAKAQKLRRYSPEQNEFIKEEVKRMLDAGIIRESQGNWSTNVVIVEKKNGKQRLCVDYRALNSITKEDKYPLPNIQETLDSIAGAKWFSTIDLASGYWQMKVADEDIEKTAFVTAHGFYEFRRMPFGLTNAPAAFQRLMDRVLRNEIGRFVQVYLDDIIIYSKSWEEHLEHIEQVFKRLEEAGLKMGRAKCFFAKKEIEFLGHIVNEEGIKTSPKLVEKIKNFPIPETKTEARSFIGTIGYYRKFIKDFSKIAKPIFGVTSNDDKVEFKWGPEQQEAMDILKEKILEDVVLKHPDFNKEFILYVDASKTGLGAVLSQEDENGIIRPIAFASRTINKTEGNYSATENEMHGMYWAIAKRFKPYLTGRKFTVVTDHQALKRIRESDEGSKKINRWRIYLEGYTFDIEYKPGKTHGNADGLSRM